MFFFFKQKTAYEMRISDWSSDVCSSDLLAARHLDAAALGRLARGGDLRRRHRGAVRPAGVAVDALEPDRAVRHRGVEIGGGGKAAEPPFLLIPARSDNPRSEEHTSELQSLMRLSYAVFCLKKKKK